MVKSIPKLWFKVLNYFVFNYYDLVFQSLMMILFYRKKQVITNIIPVWAEKTYPSIYLPAVHPVINVRNQLVGSPFEKDVTIECNVEASPKSINYWIKDIKDGKFVHFIYILKCSSWCTFIVKLHWISYCIVF